MTTLIYDDVYLKHDTGANHPENAARLINTIEYLRSANIWQTLDVKKPRAATKEEVSAVHTISQIEQIAETAETGGGHLDPDTYVSPDSYEAALYASGALLTAIDLVMDKKTGNAFCLVRPPGHHATPTRSMGFCLFNNVAIAAKYIQSRYNIDRIVIIDWDVHHGNGTQDTFYDDPSVLYFSMHKYPFYPGTGGKEETGRGSGSGFTINVPLSYNTQPQEYIKIFKDMMKKRVKSFKPQFVLISSGFDAYRLDPISGLSLEASDFNTLTKFTRSIANDCCEGRVVSCLEGGYHLLDLPKCVEEHLNGLVCDI
ncbi:deacetylase, including yeast histone deacetylase and acetoin utilization protein [Candidatus Scalindua japonica]|uniref:Deacetylase, including yeast histone deacetylase and acetoin utilization protein n=1 Tax=Candidatus Scalindua japonica TaxID=1284222 RepID=A0A286U3N5_9BACT|nr:histone deacetylase [Candidatus Scalindua japonica]GAX62726.1 deacetylase, including yeast histone deacetylase and acetoin utilization protein [Candidatus Scalindua japonica]